MTAAVRAAAPFLPDLRPPNPDAPGQFAFADGERVRRILAASGWTDVDIRAIDLPSSVAEQDLARLRRQARTGGAALREADESTRARTTEAVRGCIPALRPERHRPASPRPAGSSARARRQRAERVPRYCDHDRCVEKPDQRIVERVALLDIGQVRRVEQGHARLRGSALRMNSACSTVVLIS